MVKPRFEGPVISVRLGDQAPECYERPNGDRGLEVVAPRRKTRQEVKSISAERMASTRSGEMVRSGTCADSLIG